MVTWGVEMKKRNDFCFGPYNGRLVADSLLLLILTGLGIAVEFVPLLFLDLPQTFKIASFQPFAAVRIIPHAVRTRTPTWEPKT